MTFSKLQFSKLKKTSGKIRKNSSPGQLLGCFSSRRYHWLLVILVSTQRLEIWDQKYMWLFYYFSFEGNYELLESMEPWFLLNKSINFKQNETESKMENSTRTSEKRNLRFSSDKNRELKVNVWWVAARERKKGAFFCNVYFVRGIFFIQEYLRFYISKNITSNTFRLFLKSSSVNP